MTPRDSPQSALLEAFGRTPELGLRDFFMDSPLFDFTRSEITEALGMNKRTLYKTLPKLEEMKIVKVSRKIVKAKLYTLNRDSPIVSCLRNVEKELSTSKVPSLRELRGIDKEHKEALLDAIRELNAEHRKKALE